MSKLWDAFAGEPASARPLAALRIGVAAILLAQTAANWGHLDDFYSSTGIVQQPIADSMAHPFVIRISWCTDALAEFGVDESGGVRLLYLWYTFALAALLVGWRTRLAACAAWLLHLAFIASAQASSYGVYQFAQIALFYCAVMPVGHAWSLDRFTGRTSGAPSHDARIGLRVLQLHLCIAYFASGVEKACGRDWWNGESVWRAVMRPDLGQFDCSFLAAAPWLAKLACLGTLLIEVGYPFFVAFRPTRKLAALAAIGMHLGIAVVLGLWYFSAIMIVLNVAAFLVPATNAGREIQ